MKSSFHLLCIALVVAANISIGPAFGQEKKEPWTGFLRNGTVIDEQQLKKILSEHKKWWETDGEQGQKADLQGAGLEGANLQEADLQRSNLQRARLARANLQRAYLNSANLQEAYLEEADLQRAFLAGASLQGAQMTLANLQRAYLNSANLQEAYLEEADLQEAYLGEANLKEAYLGEANLQGAKLRRANLQDANFDAANLKGVIFEIEPNNLPDIPSMGAAFNLSLLRYTETPHSLVELREAFKKMGLRKQEREITYAIKHSGYQNELERGNLLTKIEVVLGRIFFEFTCNWGMSPERPLFILLALIFLFTLPYTHAISGDINGKEKTDGIWMVWIPERMRDDMGRNEPKVILDSLNGCFAFKMGFYFSALSAFHFGWRELNVGNWIARMQFYEYRLQATGWARFVSGLQSLISVYLLALAVLAYFGRPFESY